MRFEADKFAASNWSVKSMFRTVMQQASDAEIIIRARQRIAEMNERYSTAESVTGKSASEYMRLCQLRREALDMHSELTQMHQALPQDSFGLTNATLTQLKANSGDTGSLVDAFASKSVVGQLLSDLEKSPFFKNNGKAILKAKPVNLPLSGKMLNSVLNAYTKLAIYSRTHPVQAAGIAIGILAAKLLFVYVVWKLISTPVKAFFGIHSKKKKSDSITSTPQLQLPPVATPMPIAQVTPLGMPVVGSTSLS